METRRLLVVPFVLLLLGVGVVVAFSAVGMSPATIEPTAAERPGEAAESPDAAAEELAWMEGVDLESDPIGCIGEICHDDELGIDQSDGLTDEEFELLVQQSMARVEYLREQRFKEPVPVELMTREEYRERVADDDEPTDEQRAFDRWNDQVWQALWIVDGETSANAEIDRTFGTAVVGFYSSANEQITLVVDDDEQPAIRDTTLIHELGHAMQDQYHDLGDSRYRGATQDEDLAIDGIVEGEVVYVETQYEERCQTGEWECASPPASGGGGGDTNFGIFLTIFQPYSDGPGYAHDIVEADGWDGVADRMDDPPVSTTQVIHRTDREPRSIEFDDEATDGWETYSDQGVDGAETVGEASIYAMFYYQSREYDAGAIDWRELNNESHPYETYNYVSEPSDGWAGDELYPYRRGDDEDGYVWVTEWRTPADAIEFAEAYDAILNAHGAERTDRGIEIVEDGGYSGAYGVHVEDTRVTVVYGPTEAAIGELRPSVADSLAADEGHRKADDSSVVDDDGDDQTGDDTEADGDGTDDTDREDAVSDTVDVVPGFTPAAAVIAISTVLLWLGRRN